jgi:hypothetical protein
MFQNLLQFINDKYILYTNKIKQSCKMEQYVSFLILGNSIILFCVGSNLSLTIVWEV